MSTHLFVNVSGGSTLTQEMKARFESGDNAVKVKNIGPDTDFGSIDVVERGGTRLGSLELIKAEQPKNKNGSIAKNKSGATLHVRAKNAGDSEFSVQSAVAIGVEIRHRLVLSEDGAAEFSSKAILTNGSKTPIKDAELTITAGDTNNHGGGYRAYSDGPALESARSAGTTVTAAGSNVYRFDLKDPVSLAKGERLPISLFDKDMVIGKVDKTLDLNTSARYISDDTREYNAGAIATTYTVENNEANGMGVVLPRGSVEIKRPDGMTLSNTDLQGDISAGEALTLRGGNAFDLTATRATTAYKAERVAGGDGDDSAPIAGRPFVQKVQSSQEIKVCSKADKEETVNINERLPQGAKVSNLKVNGQDVPADGYSVDARQNLLKIPGNKIPANGEAKVTYDLEFSHQIYG